jgi:arsenate reductase
MPDKPTVLFVCVHNAGRSQMAAGWLTRLAGGTVDVRSAGSEPVDQIHPVVVEAMREVGIDIARAQPKLLSYDVVREADVVITMGCGDTCAICPGKRYEDWDVEDPAGKDITVVRRIGDDIRQRVETLLRQLIPARSDA